jgi:GNAT superfamily N-acetyltransferase
MNDSRPEIVVRPFEASDLDAVKKIILSTIETCYAGVYPARAIDYFKKYHSDEQIRGRADSGLTVVGLSQGKLVATGTVVKNHICAVFVVQDAQRLGLGRKIMEFLENKAGSAGFDEITLDVSLPSRRFYERLGYSLSDDTSIDVGDGQRLDYWTARKKLA